MLSVWIAFRIRSGSSGLRRPGTSDGGSTMTDTNTSNLAMIWTSSDRAIVFHITSTGNLEYMVTEDGGLTWKPATTLIEDATILAVNVDYYGWYRGSHQFDWSMVNYMAVMANSEDHVYVYRMDSESFEILDAQRKQFPMPIRGIASHIRFDGAISILVDCGPNLGGEFEMSIISPPERKSSPHPEQTYEATPCEKIDTSS